MATTKRTAAAAAATIDPRTMRDFIITDEATRWTIGTVRVPATHPAAATVRRIGWKALDAATEAKQHEALRQLAAISEVANKASDLTRTVLMESARSSAQQARARVAEAIEAEGGTVPPEPEPAAPKKADPLDMYSTPVLVARGLATIDGVAVALDDPRLDELSPAAMTAIATAVLRISAPEAYETEDDRGNG